jgi:hypothetical protein
MSTHDTNAPTGREEASYGGREEQFGPGQGMYGAYDYRRGGYGYGYRRYGVYGRRGYGGFSGLGGGRFDRRSQSGTETKPFFLTSEFAAAVLAVIALAITAASSASIDAWRFWLLTTGITCAYLLSRGIAKSGTRSNASDPREQLNLNLPGSDHDRR